MGGGINEPQQAAPSTATGELDQRICRRCAWDASCRTQSTVSSATLLVIVGVVLALCAAFRSELRSGTIFKVKTLHANLTETGHLAWNTDSGDGRSASHVVRPASLKPGSRTAVSGTRFAASAPSWFRSSAANQSDAQRKLLQHFIRELGGDSALSCSLVRDPAEQWPPVKPAIFTNITAGWRAVDGAWQQQPFLQKFGTWQQSMNTFHRDSWLQHVGRSGEFTDRPYEVSLSEFPSIVADAGRNMFIFVRQNRSEAMTARFGKRARRRRFFEALEADYWRPFGRPADTQEHQIFAMDGAASGHGMHRHGDAWLAQVSGRKVWWIAPPRADGVDTMNTHHHPVYPYQDLPLWQGSWPCARLLGELGVAKGVGGNNSKGNLDVGASIGREAVTRCVQHPGEVVVVPAGWWHTTCSLDAFNVAVGGQHV